MNGKGCPGRSTQAWRFEDIYTAPCPRCGGEIEFFRDDLRLPCPLCGFAADNPRADAGCAAWCSGADRCGRSGIRGGKNN